MRRKPGPQHPKVWWCACGCPNGYWRRDCFRCHQVPPLVAGAASGATPSRGGNSQQAASDDGPPSTLAAAGTDEHALEAATLAKHYALLTLEETA